MTEKSKPRQWIGTPWFLACVLAVRVLLFDLTAAHNWWDWVGVAVDVLALLVVLGSSSQWDQQAWRDARKPWREAKEEFLDHREWRRASRAAIHAKDEQSRDAAMELLRMYVETGLVKPYGPDGETA